MKKAPDERWTCGCHAPSPGNSTTRATASIRLNESLLGRGIALAIFINLFRANLAVIKAVHV
jgi:hypothetical protein